MASVLKNDSVKHCLELTPPSHGGDLAHWQRKMGDEALQWLDLSSACNREPWPIPAFDASHWMNLPDQGALLDQAERYFTRRPMAIGAGSQHIIESLPVLLKHAPVVPESAVSLRAFVPRIGYQEHAFAWQKWGYEVVYYDELGELLTQPWAVAVVIQPNNPTGEWAAADVLAQLVVHAEQQGSHLVVDEAFIDPYPERSLLMDRTASDLSESLFVLRSVGKFFGLAGARVGFVFCHSRWQNALKNVLGPWPVATPSLHLVTLALADHEWQERALKQLAVRQAVFIERIMPKFNTIFDSQDRRVNALFVTWFLDSDQGEQVFDWLHKVGVHVRLGDGWIRVALPALDEMDVLNSALIQLLKDVGGRNLV